MTRKRLRRRFGKSLRRLGGCCHTEGPHLKLKYLLDLERLQRRLSSGGSEEIFNVRSPGSAAPVAIHVCGDSGVAWSCGGSEVRGGGGREMGASSVGLSPFLTQRWGKSEVFLRGFIPFSVPCEG